MTAIPDDMREALENFSLLGGPLHRLGVRLGLVRQGTHTVLLGVALGGGMWIVVVILALLEGIADRVFSLSAIGASARLLVVIPLMFVCESWVTPRMAAFVDRITDSGIVPAGELPALDAAAARIRRWADAWWPEAAGLLAAVLLAVSDTRVPHFGASSGSRAGGAVDRRLDLFQCGASSSSGSCCCAGSGALGLWCWFLWRVSRLDLQLIPGHPDGAGGLATLSSVHERFTPLVAAISVLESAALAEDLSAGAVTMTAVYPFLALLLAMDAALFLGPLLVFTDKLWAGRTRGMSDYMGFAGRYVKEFERKWLESGDPAPGESMLGTPDLQSLADLANSVNIVREMKWVPISSRLLTQLAMAALLPLAPLLLFKYPLAELAQKLVARLIGF